MVTAFAVSLCGCVGTEKLAHLTQKPFESGGVPVEMAVIANPRTVMQDGRSINGLVVQIVTLNAAGKAVPAGCPIQFAVYGDAPNRSKQVEPDQRWTFSAEQVTQSLARAPMGVVHNFWLPLHGKLASSPEVQLLTACQPAGGIQLTQWNRVGQAQATMQIQTRSEADESAESPENLSQTLKPLRKTTK